MTTKEQTLKAYSKLYIEGKVAMQLQHLGLIPFDEYLELAHKNRGFRQCMLLNDISFAEIEACENYKVEIEKN